jgi:hypothetical protein
MRFASSTSIAVLWLFCDSGGSAAPFRFVATLNYALVAMLYRWLKAAKWHSLELAATGKLLTAGCPVATTIRAVS